MVCLVAFLSSSRRLRTASSIAAVLFRSAAATAPALTWPAASTSLSEFCIHSEKEGSVDDGFKRARIMKLLTKAKIATNKLPPSTHPPPPKLTPHVSGWQAYGFRCLLFLTETLMEAVASRLTSLESTKRPVLLFDYYSARTHHFLR